MATIFAALSPTVQWYLTLTLLSAALLSGVIFAHRVISDLKGGTEGRSDDPDDLIAPLTEAFAAGQMSKEEYDRIRESIHRGDATGQAPFLPIQRGLDWKENGDHHDPGRVSDPPPGSTESDPPQGAHPELTG